MKVEIHPNALRHGLTAAEVEYAWLSPIRCRMRSSKDEPPRWIAIGILPNGKFAELVAIEQASGIWLVFHAMVPPTKKFLRELEMDGV